MYCNPTEDVEGELKTILTTYAKDDTTDSNSAQAEFVNKYTKYVDSSNTSSESEEPTTEPGESTTEPGEPTTEPSGSTTEVQNPENSTAPPAEVVTPPASGGSSEGTPTETNHSAKTGDEAGLGLCMLCAAFALLGMAAVRRRRKRK